MLLWLFNIHILGQDEAQDDGYHEHHRDDILRKYGLEQLWEDSPDSGFCGCGEAHTDRQRQGGDGDISLGEATLGDHLYTGQSDGTEHHDGTAAENRLRQGREKVTYGRQQAGEKHTDGSGHDGKAVDHLGHVDQTYVL